MCAILHTFTSVVAASIVQQEVEPMPARFQLALFPLLCSPFLLVMRMLNGRTRAVALRVRGERRNNAYNLAPDRPDVRFGSN